MDATDRYAPLTAADRTRLQAFADRMPLVAADYLAGYGPRFAATFTIGECKRLRFQRYLAQAGRWADDRAPAGEAAP